MKKNWTRLTTLLLSCLLIAGCSSAAPENKEPEASEDKLITIGASTNPHAEILEFAAPLFEEKGYELKIVEFSDYVLPNTALEEGDLDANYFQHFPYLEQFNADNNTHLASLGGIHFEPLGIYKGKNSDLADVEKGGASFAIPNDGTNEARALQLLESLGYIKLKDGVGLKATPIDIVENPYDIEIVELDASMVAQARKDVSFAIVNGNYALDAKITEDVLTSEKADSEGAQTFANVIAVRDDETETDKSKALIEIMTGEEVRNFITENYGGLVVPAE